MWLLNLIGFLLLIEAVLGFVWFNRINPWFASKLQSKLKLNLKNTLLIEGAVGAGLIFLF